eukprot:1764391-Amphidinium_carterae.1
MLALVRVWSVRRVPYTSSIHQVVRNTDAVHNVVVCTLCSCYPSGMLGISPAWYRSREYRARTSHPIHPPRYALLHEYK